MGGCLDSDAGRWLLQRIGSLDTSTIMISATGLQFVYPLREVETSDATFVMTC